MEPSVVYSVRDGIASGGKRVPRPIEQRLSCAAVQPAGWIMVIEKPNHRQTAQEE
jgi:hypothetical protein